MESLVDICHPQDEYFPETSDSPHPAGPKFKIRETISVFIERATPVYPFLSTHVDVHGSLPH